MQVDGCLFNQHNRAVPTTASEGATAAAAESLSTEAETARPESRSPEDPSTEDLPVEGPRPEGRSGAAEPADEETQASEAPGQTERGFWASIPRSVWGNLVLVLATLILGSLASVLGWLPPRGTWMFRCARLWSRLLLASAGVRLENRFEVPLEEGRGYIYMANHQSMFDIPALIAGIPGEVRFLAKKSLFKIPIFGWALSAGGFIPVDRGNRAAAAEIYHAAKRCLTSGRSILIFPEQTRSTDGELLPFKRGGAVIALETGQAIVPVGLHGTREARPIGSWRVYPRTVTVSYGTPIEVEGRSKDEWGELLGRVRADVERLK